MRDIGMKVISRTARFRMSQAGKFLIFVGSLEQTIFQKLETKN
jgi:hypothetical protein